MNVQKLLLATLAGTIINFFGGWIIFGMLLMPVYEGGMSTEAMAAMLPEEQHNIMYYVIGSVAVSLMFAYIYERWAGIRTFVAGATVGAVVGILITTQVDCGFLASMKFFSDTTIVLIDILANGFMGALTGGVVAWVLGLNRA